jgi:hypothetical protein
LDRAIFLTRRPEQSPKMRQSHRVNRKIGSNAAIRAKRG